MARFKFRLEAALRLKRIAAEAESEKLRNLMLERQKLENSLKTVGEERVAACASVQRSDGVRSVDLRALSSFILGLEARTRILSEALCRVNIQLAEQRKRLLRAEQDEHSLNKLRVKRLTEWNLSSAREIENTAQELWLLSHTRNTEA